MSNLLEVRDLRKLFPVKESLYGGKRFVHAVNGVSFNIEEGENFGLVGESGCGKTTTARLILRLIEPTGGTVRFMGMDIYGQSSRAMGKLRPKMQLVFQNPFSSLNPRKTLLQILSRPYELHATLKKSEIRGRVLELLDAVGLGPPEKFAYRYPHELSGGQRQRVGIARAICLQPKFIIADEPVSSLDMSIRAHILNLMKDLQKQMGLTYLFITHDLALVRSICDRVAVMYLGNIVELAKTSELYKNSLHPYTRALLSATPIPDPELSHSRKRLIIGGEVPSPIDLPSGCPFHPRCPYRLVICNKEKPSLVDTGNSHYVACFLM